MTRIFLTPSGKGKKVKKIALFPLTKSGIILSFKVYSCILGEYEDSNKDVSMNMDVFIKIDVDEKSQNNDFNGLINELKKVWQHNHNKDNNDLNIKPYEMPLSALIGRIFKEYDFFIFFFALGAVIRIISPFIASKLCDPGVIVVDERGNFVISALAGHIGGANELSKIIANRIQATAVITTATDVSGKFAVDMFSKKFGFYIENPDDIKTANKASLNDETFILYMPEEEFSRTEFQNVENYFINYGIDIKINRSFEGLAQDINLNINSDIRKKDKKDKKDKRDENAKLILITHKKDILRDTKDGLTGKDKEHMNNVDDSGVDNGADNINNLNSISGSSSFFYLRPKHLIVGIGCNKDTSFKEIEEFAGEIFNEHNLSLNSIRNTATIDIKNKEKGIALFSEKYADFIDYYSKEEINDFMETVGNGIFLPDASPNSSCFKYTGAYSVCEPCALLSSKNKELLICKKKKGNVTIAVALAK